MAASIWGTTPSVQPKAAMVAVRVPRERPVAMLTAAPVPGEATTSSETVRNSRFMGAPWNGGHPDARVAAGLERNFGYAVAQQLGVLARNKAEVPREKHGQPHADEAAWQPQIGRAHG